MAAGSQTATLLGGTVGIVGLGNIGLCVCKRLICAGFRVKTCEIKEETRAMLVKMGADRRTSDSCRDQSTRQQCLDKLLRMTYCRIWCS